MLSHQMTSYQMVIAPNQLHSVIVHCDLWPSGALYVRSVNDEMKWKAGTSSARVIYRVEETALVCSLNTPIREQHLV